MICLLAVAYSSVLTAPPPAPNFPVSWTATESESIAIAQGTIPGPKGEICCDPTSVQCQAQVQAQVGTHYWNGDGNQTRFDVPGKGITITDYILKKEMAVSNNLTCTEYCPTEGNFDPSPFWPDDTKQIIHNLGKTVVNGVEVQHYQWVEHILGVVKLQETNLYVKLPTANETTATPVWEHDIIEPFGQKAGTEDTHWTAFKAGQPDPALFKVTGAASCPMSDNCGNSNSRWLMRRLRDKDFLTYAKYAQ